MINRIKHLVDPVPEWSPPVEYYEVEAYGDTYIVPLYTALVIERQVESQTRWLEFRDLFGAWHRIPTSFVVRISESTPATRAAARAFERARREEKKGDSDPFCEVD